MTNTNIPTDCQTLEEAAAEVELERSVITPSFVDEMPLNPEPDEEAARTATPSELLLEKKASTAKSKMSFDPDTFIDDSLVMAPKASAKKKKKDTRPPLVLSPYAPRVSARRIVRR